MKTGFVPISLEEHVELHLKDDSDTIREEITAALRDALGAHKRGAKCYNCGNHVWVIGSAFTHNLRFTCITGEAIPEDDYEIDDACY